MQPGRDERVDIGFEAAKLIADVWQIDDDRTVWERDGFDWWPGHYRVALRVSNGVVVNGVMNYKVSVSTDFIKNVDLDNPMLPPLLHLLQKTAPSFALKVIPQEVRDEWQITDCPSVRLESNAYVDELNISWMPRFFSGMAILSVIEAQIRASEIAENLGAEPDTSAPFGSELLDLDEILYVVRDIYLPESGEASRWSETGEFDEIAETYGRLESCFGNGDGKGLTLEVPFGSDTALVQLHTTQAHPRLGNGLLATLKLPVFLSDPLSMESNWYNLLELIGDSYVPLMGSWVTDAMGDEQGVIAFSSFVPNLLYQPGIATNMALWMCGRAKWARETFFSDMDDEPLEEILKRRFERVRG